MRMSGGTVTLPAIRHREKKTAAKKPPVAMDLEAIRERRARLEAMTNAKRFGTTVDFAAQRTRPSAAPSSASKMRKKHHDDPSSKTDNSKTKKSVRLLPISNRKSNPQGNELDRQRASDPLLKKPALKKQEVKKETPKKTNKENIKENKKEVKKEVRSEAKKEVKKETKKEVKKENKKEKKPILKSKNKNPKGEVKKKEASTPSVNNAGKGSRSYTGGNYFILRDSDYSEREAYTAPAAPIEEPELNFQPIEQYEQTEEEEEEEDEEPLLEEVPETQEEPEEEEQNENERIEIEEDPVITMTHERRAALRLLNSLQEGEQLEGAMMARRHLSVAVDPPIDEYIHSGAVPLLISLLDKHHNPKLQFEALWALTNIASGSSEQTKTVVEAGGIPPIARLLSSSDPEVVDQAVWAVGNIAGDGPEMRDVIVRDRIVPHLDESRKKISNPGAHRNMAWTISNLVRPKPCMMGHDDWKTCLQALKEYLRSNDTSVKLDAAWGLSYASDGDQEAVQRVLDLNILGDVALMLTSNDEKIAKVALRIAGNIVSGSDSQTDRVIAAGIVPRLLDILDPESQKSTSERKEAAWALSNITAGSNKQIQAVFDAGAVPILVDIMRDDTTPFSVYKEVIWCLGNSSNGDQAQVNYLVKQAVIPVLINFLSNHSSESGVMFSVVLDFISNVLERATEVERLRADLRSQEETLQVILEAAEQHEVAPGLKQRVEDFIAEGDLRDEGEDDEDDYEDDEDS